MKKIVIYSILILIGMTIIGIGVFIVWNSNSKEKTKTVDYENTEKKYSISIPEDLKDKVSVEFIETGVDFYYSINIDEETEKILLFFIRSEDEINKLTDEEVVDNVSFVGEANGIKYYSATSTGVIVDTVVLKDQISSDETSNEEKEKLQLKLQEYNNIIEIYNNKDEIFKTFISIE